MNRKTLTHLVLVGAFLACGVARAGIIEDLSNATIIEDFQFNDDAGTLWSAAVNSANAGNLLTASAAGDATALTSVVTDGSGNLNASLKANIDNGRMLVDTPINVVSRRVLGVMELTWNFTSELDTVENEELRLTLINSGTTSVTAEWEILRNDDNQLEIFGTAIGTGSSNISSVVLNSGSLSQSTKFIAVVDANLDTDKYYVHFSADGGVNFTTIGPGNIDPARIVDKMRVYLNNDLSGDNVLIDRAYLATIPEPAACALAGLAFVGFLASRYRAK